MPEPEGLPGTPVVVTVPAPPAKKCPMQGCTMRAMTILLCDDCGRCCAHCNCDEEEDEDYEDYDDDDDDDNCYGR